MDAEPVVHIVDDNDAIRKSLQLLLGSVNIKSQQYASGKEFIDKYIPGGPGCLLLDVRMPGLTGLDLQEILPKYNITLPIIIMTGYGDVPTAIRAMKLGAVDFIEKPFNHEVLFESIRICIDKSRLKQQKQKYKKDGVDKLSLLTAREREVLKLLVEGKINKVIATELGISMRTVESHRSKLMEKLKAKSLSDLVRISLLANDNSFV